MPHLRQNHLVGLRAARQRSQAQGATRALVLRTPRRQTCVCTQESLQEEKVEDEQKAGYSRRRNRWTQRDQRTPRIRRAPQRSRHHHRRRRPLAFPGCTLPWVMRGWRDHDSVPIHPNTEALSGITTVVGSVRAIDPEMKTVTLADDTEIP